jgi:hypothetical protein
MNHAVQRLFEKCRGLVGGKKAAVANLALADMLMTATLILSDDILRDEEGRITEIGRVCWYPDYAVREETEELRRDPVFVDAGRQNGGNFPGKFQPRIVLE